MTDQEFFDWLASRLVNVYGEDPNTDFVLKLRELGESAVNNKAIINWLEDNVAYIMISADLSKNRYTMSSFPNQGKGWRNGELRRAVMTQIISEK